MSSRGLRPWGAALLGTVLLVSSLVVAATAAALEAGQPAPDFRLPSTNGAEIGLADFKGKKWVFLEFYGQDFTPT